MPDHPDNLFESDEYPEHERLAKVKDESQAIGEFLDFGLGRQGIVLAFRDDHGDLMPSGKPIQKILADYFDIDEDRLEVEKRQMLERLRANAA